MDMALLGNIIKNIAVLGVAAYLTTQLTPFRHALNQSTYQWKDKAVLIAVFGFFSAVGNLLSISLMGALAHTRLVGVVVGGLLGGPVVGLGAGILGAIPRYFMSGYGEYVVYPAMTANVLIGFFSGLVCRHYGARQITLPIGLATALGSEMILKLLVLNFSVSREAAWKLETVIALPTIIATCLGVTLFLYIVRDVFAEQDKLQTRAAQQSMQIIRRARDLFWQQGLDARSAGQVAVMIHKELQAAAVAVTNTEEVLAFSGPETGGRTPEEMDFLRQVTRQVVSSRQTVIANEKDETLRSLPAGPWGAMVAAPLLVNRRLVGSIQFYKAGGQDILPYEVELVQGIADFLSLELLQGEVEAQAILLAQARYHSLKSQIHPHFLFNTLGTIRAVIRIDPDKARKLVKDLSDFLRLHSKPEREMLTIQEEMDCVDTYIRLEQARFGERVRVQKNIAESVLGCWVPVFSIQVLVENAIKHGLSPKPGGGTVSIQVWRENEYLCVRVADDGVGFSPADREKIARIDKEQEGEKGLGIGLRNVQARLQSLYSGRGLHLVSCPGVGTTVEFSIPWVAAVKEEGK